MPSHTSRTRGEAWVGPTGAGRRRAVDQMPTGRRAFRPEVQALRAVAVAAVVLYHLWPHAVPGGFVGVDVFFVISGFLITQQLAEESLTTGGVSLTRFWARRVRRILPAAFTVLAASIGIALWLMPQEMWQSNLDEIRAAALYGENWLLGTNAVDYLAAENTPSLVQHYWSLSVEEQFYLVWPLLVLLAATAARRARLKASAVLGLTLGVAFLVSLVVSVVWTRADPPMAFFATPTRAWEFAAGGLVVPPPPPAPQGVAGGGWGGRLLGVVGGPRSPFFITQDDAFSRPGGLLP